MVAVFFKIGSGAKSDPAQHIIPMVAQKTQILTSNDVGAKLSPSPTQKC